MYTFLPSVAAAQPLRGAGTVLSFSTLSCIRTVGGVAAGEERAELVPGDVVLEHRVQVVGALAVVAAGDHDLLLLATGHVHAAEGVDLGKLVALWLEQFPALLLRVELEYLV